LDILKTEINIPEHMLDVLELSDYAVSTRYPDDFKEVSKKEYQRAVDIAERVLDWVLEHIK